MRKSTPNIKAGRTLLLTLGRIRIKDGRPWLWHDMEVKALLEVWSGELIQEQNSFQTISDMLEQRSIHRMTDCPVFNIRPKYP